MQEATGRYAQLQDVRGRGGGGAETEGHVRTATTSTTTTTTTTAAPTPTHQGQGQTSTILSVSTTTTTTRATTYSNDSYDEKQLKQQNQQQFSHDGNNHSQQQKQQQVNSNYSICEEDSCSSGLNQLIWKAKGSFKRKKKQQHKQQQKQQRKQQQCNETDCENSGDGGHNHLLSKRETSSKRKKKKKQKPKQQLQLQGEGGGGGENSGKEGGVSESEGSYRFLLFSMCCSKTMVQKSMQWLLYLQQSKPSGAGDERSSSLHQGESLCGSWDSAEEEELLSGVVASPREDREEEGWQDRSEHRLVVAGQECVITVEPLPTGLRVWEEAAAPPPSPSGAGITRPYCAQNNREEIGERLARHWGKWPWTPLHSSVPCDVVFRLRCAIHKRFLCVCGLTSIACLSNVYTWIFVLLTFNKSVQWILNGLETKSSLSSGDLLTGASLNSDSTDKLYLFD